MSESEDHMDTLSDNAQEAIIGHMLHDKSFFMKCRVHLKKGYFHNPEVGEIFQVICDFYNQWNKLPTPEEAESSLHKGNFVDQDMQKNRVRLRSCLINSGVTGDDSVKSGHSVKFLSDKMTKWVRVTLYKNAVMRFINSVNKARPSGHDKRSDVEKAQDGLTAAILEANRASFDQDESLKWEPDIIEFLKTRKQTVTDAMTIGDPKFDSILREGGGQPMVDDMGNKILTKGNKELLVGSLLKGDSTVIIGPPNSGKTSSVISIMCANIIRGRKVLYIFHEQKWEDIKMKVLSCISGMPETVLTSLALTPEEAEKITRFSSIIDKNLKCIPWVKAGRMYVEDVVALIIEEQEKLKSDTGSGYDMLVDDYPGKLKSRISNKGVAKWEELDYVYDQFVNLALEHRFHAVLPTQSNREGYKINKDDSGKVVDMSEVGGSFTIVQKADNVITINRKLIGDRHFVSYYVAKCRASSTGKKFVSLTNLSVSRMHGWGLLSALADQGVDVPDQLINPELAKL